MLGEQSSAARTNRASALLENGFRTRQWKLMFPTPRVENLPTEVVGAGFEPDAGMLERFRVCKAPPPPPPTTSSTPRQGQESQRQQEAGKAGPPQEEAGAPRAIGG